jgi:hypothetical protein
VDQGFPRQVEDGEVLAEIVAVMTNAPQKRGTVRPPDSQDEKVNGNRTR